MADPFTPDDIERLSGEVDAQLRELGSPGTGSSRGGSPETALGAKQRKAIEAATGQDAMTFLTRFKRAARKDLCEQGGVLYTQWSKWKDITNKDMLKSFGAVLVGMGLSGAPLQLPSSLSPSTSSTSACRRSARKAEPMLELGLRFPDPTTVIVSLNEDGETDAAAVQRFEGPLDAAAQQDLQWYLEVYPVHYMTEVDDDRAGRIAAKLPTWGAALFDAVFAERVAGCSIAFRIAPNRAGCSRSAQRTLRSWRSRGSC